MAREPRKQTRRRVDGRPELRLAPPPSPSPPRAARPARRISRGPIVIGEPAANVEPCLAAGEPYRADTIVDGGSAFGLRVRAASVRGLGKRFVGGPRQDDICLALHEPTRSLVAALADGVSAAPRSHLGAALAVRHATAAVCRQLDAGGELDWPEVFNHAAWSLVESERASDPDADVEQASRALATTLVVAVVGGAQARLASVGDSAALLLSRFRFRTLIGGDPAGEALIGGAVGALPRALAELRSTSLELGPEDVLLLASDGFTLPLAGGENDFGAVFARELRRPPTVSDFARLLDFSRATYDDDRSLIAIWPPREP